MNVKSKPGVKSKIDKKAESEQQFNQFGKILKVLLLFGIIIVSGFVIYYVWYFNFSHEEDYVGFGILNHRKEAEDYPTVAYVNQSVEFYVTVENQLSRDFNFKIRVYRGDSQTKLSSDGSENAHYLYSTDKERLKPREDWMSDKLSVTFPVNGTNQIIIVELWEYSIEERNFYDILWLRIDVV